MVVAFDLITILSLVVVALVMVLILLIRWSRDRVADLEAKLAAVDSAKRSQAATYGRITEQFAPFLAHYPFEPRNFRFLGSPIDGVQFEDDRIIFIEFKSNTSRLSPNEDRIRRLVEAGRVEWLEFRMDERAGASASTPDAADARGSGSGEGPEFWRR